MRHRVACLGLVVSRLASAGTPADSVKIYISADMEGLTGVVTGDQLGPTGFEYAAFREVMTAEVNAAIEAARAGGATEILVADSHGNTQNLLLDKLPSDVPGRAFVPRALTGCWRASMRASRA